MYQESVAKLQKQYITAAKFPTDPSRATQYAALPQAVRDQVDKLADPATGEAESKTLSGGSFTWPI